MPGALAPAVVLGFAGKLPARGDFVVRGLPRSFRDPWDAWLAAVVPASRARLGEDWLPSWLEAPAWRFALPAGLCGPDAVAGLLLPSGDRVGRHWPLTIAAVIPGSGGAGAAVPVPDAGWLEALEAVAVEATRGGAEPDHLATRLAPLLPDAVPLGPGAAGLWWTQGGPRVAPRRFAAPGLPSGEELAGMLTDAARPVAAVAEGEPP